MRELHKTANPDVTAHEAFSGCAHPAYGPDRVALHSVRLLLSGNPRISLDMAYAMSYNLVMKLGSRALSREGWAMAGRGKPNRSRRDPDLQEWADVLCAEHGIRHVQVWLTLSGQGRAHYADGWVSVPVWAMEHSEEYGLAYVCHELSHIAQPWGHTERQRAAEQRLLASIGLTPARRGRAYVKAYAGPSGAIITRL